MRALACGPRSASAAASTRNPDLPGDIPDVYPPSPGGRRAGRVLGGWPTSLSLCPTPCSATLPPPSPLLHPPCTLHPPALTVSLCHHPVPPSMPPRRQTLATRAMVPQTSTPLGSTCRTLGCRATDPTSTRPTRCRVPRRCISLSPGPLVLPHAVRPSSLREPCLATLPAHAGPCPSLTAPAQTSTPLTWARPTCQSRPPPDVDPTWTGGFPTGANSYLPLDWGPPPPHALLPSSIFVPFTPPRPTAQWQAHGCH